MQDLHIRFTEIKEQATIITQIDKITLLVKVIVFALVDINVKKSKKEL